MTAGDRTESIGSGEDREAECKRNAGETDSEFGKRRGEHCRAAAPEDQPERTEEFSEEFRGHGGSPSWKRVANGALGLSHSQPRSTAEGTSEVMPISPEIDRSRQAVKTAYAADCQVQSPSLAAGM